MKILFLYTELAGYTMACLKELEKHTDGLHLVRWPVNNEAPFRFEFSNKTSVYERNDLSTDQLLELSKEIGPHLIYASGWIDKGYLEVCKHFKRKIPVVVGFDNQWTGGLKQTMASLLSFKMIKPYFSHAWIPGEPQRKFAQKLGFGNRILTGVYSADVPLFKSYGERAREKKARQLPHRFLYVGRYVEWKGINELFEAFRQLGNDRQDWELWCVGAGELFDERPEIEGVSHLGFKQPNELSELVAETSVFILPSKFEPWGVVLHEYAAAGFPLISSGVVGASSAFLQDEVNGFIINPKNVESIKKAMARIIGMSDQEIIAMGERSVHLAQSITPEVWSDTLINLVK